MIKIVSITNYNQFNGIELTEAEFVKLLEVLEFGSFHYVAKVIKDGKQFIYSSRQ